MVPDNEYLVLLHHINLTIHLTYEFTGVHAGTMASTVASQEAVRRSWVL